MRPSRPYLMNRFLLSARRRRSRQTRVRLSRQVVSVLLWAVFICLPCQAQSDTDLPQFTVGQSIKRILDDLRLQGMPFAYSSVLLPGKLVVRERPKSKDVLSAVREVLRPHGLTIQDVDGLYVVSHDDGASSIVGYGAISLSVRDADTKYPLPGVQIRGLPRGVEPNRQDDGRVLLSRVRAGHYDVTLSLAGYTSLRETIELTANATKLVSVELYPETPALSEVIVSASRYQLLRDAVDAPKIIDQRAITQLPDLGDDPLRAVQRLPGAASSGASGRTHLRGGTERQTGIVLDGHRLLDPFHIRDYQSLFSAIDVRAIDGIEVYTGAFPIQFGDITDGLILVDTLTPEERRRTEVGVSIFNTSVLSVGQIAGGEAEWVFSARRSNLDAVLDEKLGNPSYYDVFGKISVNFTPTTTISANGFIVNDQVEVVTASDPDEREESTNDTRNTQFWISWDQKWSESLASQTQFSFSDFVSDREASINDPEKIVGQISDQRAIKISRLLHDWSYEPNDSHHLKWGVELQQATADYRYVSAAGYFGFFRDLPGNANSQSRNIDTKVDGDTFAFYLSDRWKLGDKTVADLGLRWDKQDYTDTDDDSQLSPRASILYAINPKTNIRASWGRYFQSQGIHELQVEDGVTEFFPAQRSDHSIIGLQYQFDERYSFRAEVYSKSSRRLRPRYENLFDVLTVIAELEPDRLAINADRANARGLELSLAYERDDHFSWWATYTLSKAEDTIDGVEVPRNWDQKHAGQLGFAWTGDRWSVSAAAKMHSGWPKTDVFLDTSSDPSSQTVVFGERNASRFGSFFTLDLRIDYKRPLATGSLTWFFEVSNATNRNNPCCVDFDLDEDLNGNIVLDKKEEYWFPIIPATGFLWEF